MNAGLTSRKLNASPGGENDFMPASENSGVRINAKRTHAALVNAHKTNEVRSGNPRIDTHTLKAGERACWLTVLTT